MTQRHLDDLENALNRSHWIVSERLPSNNYEISGYWTICRPDGSHQTTLSFDGLDDLNTLPMDKAFGCNAKSIEGASLHFSKGSSWNQNLREFITVLEAGMQS